MEQEAVQVRPLRQITGESEFNELFIDGARIPDENVLGGVGNGWKVALTTLMNERAGLAFFLQVRLRQLLDRLIAEAAARGLLDDPVVADRLGEMHLKAEVLRLTAYRGLTAIEKYGQPGPEGSLTKWMWSETNQQLTQLAADLLGPAALDRRRPLVLRAAARPRQLDRGRHHRGAQEHRRRAGARPAQGPIGAARNGLRPDRGPAGDQERRAGAARRALAVCQGARGRARPGEYDAALWAEIIELGWPGIAVAEQYGGQGLGAVELAVLLEELGYACAATPFLSTAVAAAAIQAGGTDEQRERWLPGLVAGELRAGVGTPGAGRRRPRRRRRGADRRRRGTARGRSPAAEPLRRSTPPAGSPRVGRGDGEALLGERSPTACAPPSRPRSSGVCQRGAGDDARLRQGAQAVRRSGRLLPGGRAPLRPDAAAHRERSLDRVLRGLGCRRRAASGSARRRRWPPRPARPPPARSRPRRSRPTAGSGSRGRPMSTGSTSAARSTGRCSAAPSATTPRSPGRRRSAWRWRLPDDCGGGRVCRISWRRDGGDRELRRGGEQPRDRQPQGVTA